MLFFVILTGALFTPCVKGKDINQITKKRLNKRGTGDERNFFKGKILFFQFEEALVDVYLKHILQVLE